MFDRDDVQTGIMRAKQVVNMTWRGTDETMKCQDHVSVGAPREAGRGPRIRVAEKARK